MSIPRLQAAVLVFAVAAALFAGGCGGGGDSSSNSGTTTQEGQESTISTAEVSELGAVLVDSKGFTVYAFAKDQGTTSSCYGACAESWPPVLVKGEPSGGGGASSSEIGTTKRKDGTTQVTYAGHPLYNFVEDKSAGEANGNGVTAFGAVWNALDESGTPLTETGEPSPAY